MRLHHIPWPRELELAAVGVCSAAGSVAASLSDVALQIIGVPLPVVLAAAAGAAIARSYAPPAPFLRALGIIVAWTVAGCALAPLVQAVFAAGAAKLGFDVALPTNMAAAFAGITAAAPWWFQWLWPMVQARFGLGVARNGGDRG